MILLFGLTQLLTHTNKRVVNHVQKLYKSEIIKLTAYTKDNGFELSREKTCLMLFNNGENPKAYLKEMLKCCFTSTETVGLLGTGTQDGHLDFHTAPEL